ncbi:hypothetical protein ACLOJK_005750 [Asimina triloba]
MRLWIWNPRKTSFRHESPPLSRNGDIYITARDKTGRSMGLDDGNSGGMSRGFRCLTRRKQVDNSSHSKHKQQLAKELSVLPLIAIGERPRRIVGSGSKDIKLGNLRDMQFWLIAHGVPISTC